MNISIRKVILSLLILCAAIAQAQEISVASFKMLDNDLTANTTGTMERDQNGEIAALIKVVSPEQGFVFDGGMVGIVKAKQEVGEVWVYVPHGIKRITVKHPTLGILRDYYFPIPIEKARTYEMKLTTGRVETIVTHTVNKQFVTFTVSPANAVVELGDELLMVDSEGYAEKSVPLGTYNYRVSCPDYQTEAGQVTVTKDNKAEVSVTLRPNFGGININGAEEYHGALIFIDNERVGQLPLTITNSKVGEHHVKVMKPQYKTFTQQITVAANDTVELDVTLAPNFAKVSVISADEQGEIWIDSKKVGTGKWEGNLEIGEYKIEVKKEGHMTVSDVLSIYDLTERTFRMGAPKRAMTSIEISSRPSKAKVYIDGELVGETPLIKGDISVGEHQVKFERDGYQSVEKSIVLKEEGNNTVIVEMVKAEAASINDTSAKSEKPQAAEKITKPEKTTITEEAVIANKEDKDKGRNWRILLGANLATAYNPLYMGGEIGFSINRISLTTTVEHHYMGEYDYFPNRESYFSSRNLSTESIELLRFTTKLGYDLPLGKHFLITPQVGMIMGTSCLSGSSYLYGSVLEWGKMEEGKHYNSPVLHPYADYTQMNNEIKEFVGSQFGLVTGVRFEVNVAKSRLGLHFTPEYLFKIGGLAFSGGVVIRL